MSLGLRYIASVMVADDLSALTSDYEHLFKESELPVYEFVRDFVREYGALPTRETLEAHTGEVLPKAEDPPSYYRDVLQQRWVELSLRGAVKEAQQYLGVDGKDPEKALDVLSRSVMDTVSRRNSTLVHDFRQAYDLVFQDYLQTWTSESVAGVTLGWPTLDDMTNGLVTGDVLSMVGRTGAGKSWLVFYNAHHAWKHQGRDVMLVTMEMSHLLVEQRLAAMEVGVPPYRLKRAGLSKAHRERLKEGLTKVRDAPNAFWVVDGNMAATVDDVWTLMRSMKPDVVYIDGAYLLKHPTERDRYKRVAENSDLIKQKLSAEAPVVASWQFSREAARKLKKKKKGDEVGLEDIGYADSIAQVSSVVLGMFEEESVETMQRRRVEIMKGRSGEVGKFFVKWDFENADFSETSEDDLEELDSI